MKKQLKPVFADGVKDDKRVLYVSTPDRTNDDEPNSGIPYQPHLYDETAQLQHNQLLQQQAQSKVIKEVIIHQVERRPR